jgi:hypothetical protein
MAHVDREDITADDAGGVEIARTMTSERLMTHVTDDDQISLTGDEFDDLTISPGHLIDDFKKGQYYLPGASGNIDGTTDLLTALTMLHERGDN